MANDSDTVVRNVYCASRVVVSVNHTRSMETTRNCRNREIESCRVHNFGGEIKNNETTKEMFFFSLSLSPRPQERQNFHELGRSANESLERSASLAPYPSKRRINFKLYLRFPTFHDRSLEFP